MKSHAQSIRSVAVAAFAAALSSFLIACASQPPLPPPVDFSKYGNPPMSASVIVLIPEEFRGRTVGAFYGGGETAIEIGRDAARELKTAFTYEFATVETWDVRDDADARAILSPGDPDHEVVRKYDFVVIPRITSAETWHKGQRNGVSVVIVAEFHTSNGSAITTVKGSGEASTGKYAGPPPHDVAELAVQYAVSAILDAVEERRDIFSR